MGWADIVLLVVAAWVVVVAVTLGVLLLLTRDGRRVEREKHELLGRKRIGL